MRLHACVRAALMSASALVLLSSCRSTVSPSPTPPPVPTSPPQLTPTYRPAPSPATAAVPHPTVIALLADYRLVALHPDAGGTLQEILPALPTANLPPIDFAAGHYLAQSSDGSLLIAPRPAPPSQPNQIALIKATSLQLERMVLLPASAGSIRSVVVGAVTGRIYVFGDREQDATLTVLDAGTGTVLNLWTLRGGDGRDWLVYQGAVSADEQRVFASYHGTDTTGIDWFTLIPQGVQRCPATMATGGCLRTHGGFLLEGEHIVATTGEPEILVLSLDGQVQGTYDTKLVGNHLMEFAIDGQMHRLYALGPCGYLGGVSVLPLLASGAPQGAATVLAPAVCGERLTLVTPGRIAVTETRVTVPNPTIPGSVVFLDTTSGTVVARIAVPAEPIDVLTL